MNTYPTFFATLQNATNSQPMAAPMNWNFTQSIQITSQPNPNTNYREISKEFLEKYASSNALGVGCMGHFYKNDSLISLHTHQFGVNYLYELVGYENFKNKLIELNIPIIKYHSITHTAQPVGKKSVMITFYGQGEIGGRNYQVESTIILQFSSGVAHITNHVLNIFM